MSRGYIRIDVSDIMDELDDDDLLEECESRKLSTTKPGESVDREIAMEAYDALRRHATGECLSILERLLFPKWRENKTKVRG